MTDQLISFKTAKLAREKGFNIISRFGHESSLYDKKGNHDYYTNYGFMYSGLDKGYIYAPTQSLLQKWLREKHNMHIVLMTSMSESNKFEMSIEEIIKAPGTDMTDSIYCKDTNYNTYEEALEEGLYQALNLI